MMKILGFARINGALSKGMFAAVALLVVAACLQTIQYLNASTISVSQGEAAARNQSASALFVELATLAQPPTTSSITQTVHQYVRQHKSVNGITLVDAEDHLIAHLGNGNDSLLNHPVGSPTARVPINADGQLYGHAIIVFNTNNGSLRTVFHYFTLAVVAVVLLIAAIALLRLLAAIILSLIRQTPSTTTLEEERA